MRLHYRTGAADRPRTVTVRPISDWRSCDPTQTLGKLPLLPRACTLCSKRHRSNVAT